MENQCPKCKEKLIPTRDKRFVEDKDQIYKCLYCGYEEKYLKNESWNNNN